MRKEYEMTTKCRRAETAVRRFINKNNGFFGEHTADIVATLNLMARTDIEVFKCIIDNDIISYTVLDMCGDKTVWYVDVVVKTVEDRGQYFTNDNNKVREYLNHDLKEQEEQEEASEQEEQEEQEQEQEEEEQEEASEPLKSEILEMSEPSRWSLRFKLKVATLDFVEAGNVVYHTMVNKLFEKGLDTNYIYRVAGLVEDSLKYKEPVIVLDRYTYIKIDSDVFFDAIVVEFSCLTFSAKKYYKEVEDISCKAVYDAATFNILSDFLLDDGFYIQGINRFNDRYVLRFEVSLDIDVTVEVDVTDWNIFTEEAGNVIVSKDYLHHYIIKGKDLVQCDLNTFRKKILHNAKYDARVLYGEFSSTNLATFNFGKRCKGAILWVGDICFIYGNFLFSIYKEAFARGLKMPTIAEIGSKGFNLEQLYKISLELMWIFRHDFPDCADMKTIVGGDYNNG